VYIDIERVKALLLVGTAASLVLGSYPTEFSLQPSIRTYLWDKILIPGLQRLPHLSERFTRLAGYPKSHIWLSCRVKSFESSQIRFHTAHYCESASLSHALRK